ncbi:MAG TPA: PA0069 family radical SAM protein [Devosia sp.]|nr:PA0069 family radical SAM protein [Devosia sp.]
MALRTAPSFEQLEKLAFTRDADLIRRKLADPRQVRGRGAQSNRSGRFEREVREEFDDGWNTPEAESEPDPLKPFETIEHIEHAKSIITRNESPDIGFDRSINAYRGCEHGCAYCFARPTHAYLGHSAGIDFERDIYVKVNAPDLLREQLADRRYRPKPIAMGTNTDPYQPAERTHKLTRQILEVMLETRHPVTICTKSALVVRDIDILSELAKLGLTRVALSITSMDHILSRKLEPRASTPARRLEAMRLLSEAGIPTIVMAAPMIPAVNDMELERILDAAAAQGAKGANMILMRLPGEVRDIFREWLLRNYPDRVKHTLGLVREARGGKDNDANFHTRFKGEGAYAVLLQQRLEKARDRYGLNQPLPALRTDLFQPPRVNDRQLALF